jgi:hypothetical protein
MKIPCQLLNQHIVNKNWVHYFYFYLFFFCIYREITTCCWHATMLMSDMMAPNEKTPQSLLSYGKTLWQYLPV